MSNRLRASPCLGRFDLIELRGSWYRQIPLTRASLMFWIAWRMTAIS
jgi:hypothetical protein